MNGLCLPTSARGNPSQLAMAAMGKPPASHVPVRSSVQFVVVRS